MFLARLQHAIITENITAVPIETINKILRPCQKIIAKSSILRFCSYFAEEQLPYGLFTKRLYVSTYGGMAKRLMYVDSIFYDEVY